MQLLFYILFTSLAFNSYVLFDFNASDKLKNWRTVDDSVMGGISSSTFKKNADAYGVFSGTVSLENNGGFCSVRYSFDKTNVEDFKHIYIRLRGDGKKYQVRIKPNANNSYSYIAYFTTNGEWQDIKIPLKSMYPSFRGQKLNRPDFAHTHIEELGFLIANYKAESFELMLDKITLE